MVKQLTQSRKTQIPLIAQLAHMLAGFTIGVPLCFVSLLITASLPYLNAPSGIIYFIAVLKRLPILLPIYATFWALHRVRTKPLAALTSTWGILAAIAAFIALIALIIGIFFLFLSFMGGYC